MEAGLPLLLSNALVLGFRHGLDWDHLAAIVDIVGSASNADYEGRNGGFHFGRPFFLALLYALGHALVVVCLGFLALEFAAKLPVWVDPVMERLVGITLILLSCWVFVSLGTALKSGAPFKIQSRWSLLFSFVQARTTNDNRYANGTYSAGSAVVVGMIHGIGAETASQLLLIAGLAGLSNHAVGMAMMLAFVTGLVLSNAFLSLICAAGFRSSSGVRPLYMASSVLAGIFSFIVGIYFLSGSESSLPDLQNLF